MEWNEGGQLFRLLLCWERVVMLLDELGKRKSKSSNASRPFVFFFSLYYYM